MKLFFLIIVIIGIQICNARGCADAVLEVTTGNSPAWTWYSISDSSGNEVAPAGYDRFDEPNTMYTMKHCLVPGEYTFTINNSGYVIRANGEELASGEYSNSMKTITFTVPCDDAVSCDDSDPCTVDVCTDRVCTHAFDCSLCGRVDTTVEITTDNGGFNARYYIDDSKDNNVASMHKNIDVSNGSFEADFDTTVKHCIGPGDYTFRNIHGDGSYVIRVNGEEVASGDFKDEENKLFNVPCDDYNCDDSDPCTADVCTDRVCTYTPDCSACGRINTSVELKTDDHPGDTAYYIYDYSSKVEVVHVDHGSFDERNTEYTMNYCLDTSDYMFKILDSGGDGICCESGKGWYNVKVNGKSAINGGKFTGYREAKTFLVEPVKTESPSVSYAPITASPTKKPTKPAECSSKGESCKKNADCCGKRCILQKGKCKT